LHEPERSDVLDIYQRYCEATGRAVEDAVEVTVIWEKKQRPGGNYAHSARTFAVVTAAGLKSVFSMDKVLQAVAE
jgi:hypothetical protein